MRKWLILVLVFSLVATNGLWLYAAIDLMATEKYRQQLEYQQGKQIDSLKVLTSYLVSGMNKEKLRLMLEEKFPSDVIFEKEGFIFGAGLSFQIGSQDTIVGVTTNP